MERLSSWAFRIAHKESFWSLREMLRTRRATVYLMMPNRSHDARDNRNEAGFAILAIMGLLTALTIAITILLASRITSHEIQNTDTERQNLHSIGQGAKTYLQANRSWPPTLAAHNPGYAPFASTQLSQNDRLFPRYYFAHPNTSAFTNGTGLTQSDLIDVRFLLISNRSADAAPTITNASEFETWWNTDESATPDLHIYRGNLASQFHEVRLRGIGMGGSYQIDGTTTNSGGGTLANYSRYHVAGTPVSLDEADTYATPEVQFAVTSNVAYQYEPNCPVGSRWQVSPGQGCGCMGTALSIENGGFETGDLTGWTPTLVPFSPGGTNQWGAVTSEFTMSGPASGSYFANGSGQGETGATNSTGIYQRLDLSACASQVDAAELTANITGVGHGQTGFDYAFLRIVFYDAPTGGNQLGSAIDSNTATQSEVWTPLTITAPIPVGTRSIELLALGTKPSGTWIDAGVDDIAGTLTQRGAGRVVNGLFVLYTFEEGSGLTMNDTSGTGTPLNLTAASAGAINWIPGGLEIQSSTIVQSAGAASKIINASTASNEITIEAWVKPANTTQGGPSRIVTLSQDISNRNFTLAQGEGSINDRYNTRLRTTTTSVNGIPSQVTPSGTLSTTLTHVVYTRDAAGNATTYINGVQQASGTVGGDFSNWAGGYKLALANEMTLNRTWLGEYHLVAIYDSALSQAQVSQNYTAGPN